jgi:hypothetical protein
VHFVRLRASTLVTAWTLGLGGGVVVGCAPAATSSPAVVSQGDVTQPQPPRGPAPLGAPGGVVLRTKGARGLVEVIDRDGLRILTVEGVVQGARRLDRLDTAPSGDPVVALLQATSPTKRVLLAGLGTGATATELASKGAKVTVIEDDEAVVRAAQVGFGFAGAVEVEDAGARLGRTAPGTWDALVVDAFAASVPDQGALDAALALATRSAMERPVLVARLWGRPSEAALATIVARFRAIFPGMSLWGTGVGDEAQTLYVVGAPGEPPTIEDASGLALWPIDTDRLFSHALHSLAPTGRAQATEPIAERSVSVLGYLVRSEVDGSLLLDLPHEEMGARRFVIQGQAAGGLGRLIATTKRFPTSGDLTTDAAPDVLERDTLAPLVGGGGVKLSEVRFSPVAVLVEGRAKLVATAAPSRRGGASNLKHLPRGGALYAIDVSKVVATLDANVARSVESARGGALNALSRALAKSDLAGAGRAAEELRLKTSSALGPAYERCLAGFATERAVRAVTAIADDRRASTPLGLAVACDEAAIALAGDRTVPSSSFVREDRDPLRVATAALQRCALDGYDKRAARRPQGPDEAAERELAGRRGATLWREIDPDRPLPSALAPYAKAAPLDAPLRIAPPP